MTTTKHTNTDPGPRLLGLSEACQSLRISRWSLYQLINQRRIKTVRVNGRHLIAPKDLDDFVENLRAEQEVTR